MPGPVILIRGGGDLATGTALRLFRSGFAIVVTEIPAPLAVRRSVAYAEAVYERRVAIEGVPGVLCETPAAAAGVIASGGIPVLIDPDLHHFNPRSGPIDIQAVVDARLLKTDVPPLPGYLVVGLGPGFTPGVNCAAVVETMRGHDLGRVYWDRPAAANTGLPEGSPARVIRAPAGGIVRPAVAIGDLVEAGAEIGVIEPAEGDPVPIRAGIGGVVRGMIRPGIRIAAGLKIGDVDPRGDPALCARVSDKALSVGGGVLEALLSRPELRAALAGPARQVE